MRSTDGVPRMVVAAGLLAMMLIATPAQAKEHVRFPSLDRWKGSERLQLDGYLFKPAGDKPYAVIAMFHGCSGAIDKRGNITQRFVDMAALLNAMNYGVLLVDSFNPRGYKQICTIPSTAREITEAHRVLDAYGAIEYLSKHKDVIPGKIAAIGFSHGAILAIQAMDASLPLLRENRLRFLASVALYPGCSTTLNKTPEFKAYAPLLILAGELDDWTPVKYCQELAERSRRRQEPVEIVVYPGAYHGFDLTTPVRLRTDVPIRAGQGVHVGGNPTARAAAYQRIGEFFKKHLSQ